MRWLKWLTRSASGAGEDRAAEARWREHNAQARAEGCRCGRPATRVYREYRVVGSVPAEIYFCDEHAGVNSWSRIDGGAWLPGPSGELPSEPIR